MANSSRLSCFDLLLVGGLTYLLVQLDKNKTDITCGVPIVGWQLFFYFNIFALRFVLYIYCVSTKAARCAFFTLMGFLMPLLVTSTVVGTVLYRHMRKTEPECYPDDASAWSLILCLSLGWCLTYIYVLLGCTVAYRKLETTRVRYFFSIFTHISRNDPLMIRLTQADEDPESREREADMFEPLNQDGELDESFNPLSKRELSALCQEKADKSIIEEVCSICCDNFEEKQKLRKMPVCEHRFHKACIDKWLQKKPICPNCNRNVRKEANLDVEDYLL